MSFVIVSSESLANFPPFSTIESVARTPGPPAFVIIARFGPVGRGCLARIEEQLNKSRMSLTRTMPALLKAAEALHPRPARQTAPPVPAPIAVHVIRKRSAISFR